MEQDSEQDDKTRIKNKPFWQTEVKFLKLVSVYQSTNYELSVATMLN